VDVEKKPAREVGKAIERFRMIRTLPELLVLLRDRAPIDFSVCAFTMEQGKLIFQDA